MQYTICGLAAQADVWVRATETQTVPPDGLVGAPGEVHHPACSKKMLTLTIILTLTLTNPNADSNPTAYPDCNPNPKF